MQFKGYTWPHNPRTYTITYERAMALHKVPFGRYSLQNLGMSRRVMRGEGEFVGPGAYDEFKKLASLFYEETPGALLHPLWQSARVYFVALSLKQEPRQDYVRYTFTFWEDFEGYGQEPKKVGATGTTASATATTAASAAQYYTVVRGDTLWAIAVKYNLTLSRLLELNPQINNPNVINVGERLRVS